MRRTLPSVIGWLALVVAMAAPAAAAPGAGRHGGGSHPGRPGLHNPGPGMDRPGAPGRRPGDHRDHRGRPGEHRPGHDRSGWHDHRYWGPGPYYGSPYYGPDVAPPSCPDNGFYDEDGNYWYWSSADDDYVMCP